MKITLNDLTVEQKLRLLCGKDFWHNEDLNGKLPCLHMTDASMGVRMPDESNDWNGKPSVAYPSLQMLANTWNTETVKKYAECVADDCLDAGADIVLGPGVNIKRNPLCGRPFPCGSYGARVYFRNAGGGRGNVLKAFLRKQFRVQPFAAVERRRRTHLARNLL